MAQTGGALPALIGDVITDPKHYIGNLFADIWKTPGFNARIKTAGFTKRTLWYVATVEDQ